MICPRCGSRDVLDYRTVDGVVGVIYAECQHCRNVWEEQYDPFVYSKIERKEK